MFMGARDTECRGNWSYSSCEPASVGCWELNTDPLQETAPSLPLAGSFLVSISPFPASSPVLESLLWVGIPSQEEWLEEEDGYFMCCVMRATTNKAHSTEVCVLPLYKTSWHV